MRLWSPLHVSVEPVNCRPAMTRWAEWSAKLHLASRMVTDPRAPAGRMTIGAAAVPAAVKSIVPPT